MPTSPYLDRNAWHRLHGQLRIPFLIFLAVEHVDFDDSHFLVRPTDAFIVSLGQAQRRIRRQNHFVLI